MTTIDSAMHSAIHQTIHQRVTGVILAGGRNSRMAGEHKALLQWQQRSFVSHIVERLQPQVEQLVINSNQPQLFNALRLPIIADPYPDQRGPLAGILAGLTYSTTPLTLFVPCDNPKVTPQLVARLATALHDNNLNIAYAGTGTDNHYLYALMRTELRDSANRFMHSSNFAVRQWYAQQRCRRVEFDDQTACFININSATDLAQLD